MVVLVNASVYDRCCSQTVLSWTIFDVGDDSLSLSDFYQRIIRDHDCLPEEHELQEARVGRSKENLDSVNDLGEDSFYSCKYSILKCAGCVCGGGGGGGEGGGGRFSNGTHLKSYKSYIQACKLLL